MRSITMKRQTGLTLVEIMVAIAVAAILLTTVAPGFQNLILNNRLTAATNEMVSALALARSEAVRSGREVRVCPNNTWQEGWFVARSNDCALDVNAVENAQVVIRIWEAPNVTVTSAANTIRFNALGARLGAGDVSVRFHLNQNILDRQLDVNRNGGTAVSRVDPITTTPGDGSTDPDGGTTNPDDIFANPDLELGAG